MASKRKQISESEPVVKKTKRTQRYLEKYSEKYPFIKQGSAETRVMCAVCACEFGIGYGGHDDIRRHVEGPRHKKNEEIRESQKSNSKITGFFPKDTSDAVSNHDLDVIRAETIMVDLIVDLNLPMSALDKFSKAVKLMFPDSKIAKRFQCARSKGTAIVREMAAKTTLSLAERMKDQPFTISTDGSNDRGGAKLFPLVVRTFNFERMEVRSDVLSVPAIEGSATGAKIFGLIQNEIQAHDIPWENCLALGCDNANVMVGTDNGVYGCMLKEHPSLYVSGCVCHLIHIGAEKGAGCLPFSPSQLLVDVYYYLEKSSKRQAALRCQQVLHDIQETKILKHVPTRWLSIGKCLPRLISSWDALHNFFKEEEKNASSSVTQKKTKDLKNFFGSPTNKLYCMFLVDAVSVFEKINTELQSDEPLIHVLSRRLERFLKDLMIRFVKPSAMLYKGVLDVDFKTPCHIKQKADLIIGDQARTFLGDPEKNHLRPERISEFYETVVKFFQTSCTYLMKKLPLSDPLLKHIQVVDPVKQSDSSFTDLEYFLKRFPKLVEPEASTTDIQLEFSRYQCADIRQCLKEERTDAIWWAISQLKEEGKPLFLHLPKVMLSLLSIPHSSAHCERIFSVVRKNKTDFRGKMGQDTLEALVVAKCRPGDVLEKRYSDKDLRDLKSAYYRSLQSN